MKKYTLLLMLTLSLFGCTQVFLQPNKVQYISPEQINIPFENKWIETPDKLTLNAWLLNPSEVSKKSAIIFFHGNAENISSHIYSVIWLAKLGYPILAVDYRGYGLSQGKKNLTGSIADIDTSIQWFLDHYPQQQDLFIFGQSLGASMSISSLARNPALQSQINGVILEAGFSNYRLMARDALSNFWLTNLLKYPLSGLITQEYNPAKEIKSVARPVLIIHSKDDQTIPFKHAQQLYDSARSEKKLLAISGRHIASAIQSDAQQGILDFISTYKNKLTD